MTTKMSHVTEQPIPLTTDTLLHRHVKALESNDLIA